MKRLIIIPFIALLSSCGLQYTPAVGTSDISKIDFSKDLTRTEEKCAYGLFIFPPFAGSSSSAIELARESKLNKVLAIDYKVDNYLLFNKTCSVVYGN